MAQRLNEAAVPGRAAVGHHHPVARLTLAADPLQPDLGSHEADPLSARNESSSKFKRQAGEAGKALAPLCAFGLLAPFGSLGPFALFGAFPAGAAGAAASQLPDQLLGLVELLQQPVDVLDGGAAAPGNPLAAAGV